MKPTFSEPRIVSIYHDEIEVIRIVDGQTFAVNPVQTQTPSLLQVYWDNTIVYQLRDGIVEINQMVPLLQASMFADSVATS